MNQPEEEDREAGGKGTRVSRANRKKRNKASPVLKELDVRDREILNLSLHLTQWVGEDHRDTIMNVVRPYFDQYRNACDTMVEVIELPAFDRDIHLSMNPRVGKLTSVNLKKK